MAAKMFNDCNHEHPLGKGGPPENGSEEESCRSSVVEHSLGKREADGSIPSGSTKYKAKVVSRFWQKVSYPRNTTCWLWVGALDRWLYGQFKPVSRSSPLRAHRVAWELLRGPIPDGMSVLHSCDNPRCCNPEHLRLGTHADNMDDKRKRGRAWRGGPRKKEVA